MEVRVLQGMLQQISLKGNIWKERETQEFTRVHLGAHLTSRCFFAHSLQVCFHLVLVELATPTWEYSGCGGLKWRIEDKSNQSVRKYFANINNIKGKNGKRSELTQVSLAAGGLLLLLGLLVIRVLVLKEVFVSHLKSKDSQVKSFLCQFYITEIQIPKWNKLHCKSHMVLIVKV